MKKLLALALLLSIAGVASASLEIVTDYDGRELNIGETISVGIATTADLGAFAPLNWALTAEGLDVTNPDPIAITNLTNTVIGNAADLASVMVPEGQAGPAGDDVIACSASAVGGDGSQAITRTTCGARFHRAWHVGNVPHGYVATVVLSPFFHDPQQPHGSRRSPQPFSSGNRTRPRSMMTPVATSSANSRAPSMST